VGGALDRAQGFRQFEFLIVRGNDERQFWCFAAARIRLKESSYRLKRESIAVGPLAGARTGDVEDLDPIGPHERSEMFCRLRSRNCSRVDGQAGLSLFSAKVLCGLSSALERAGGGRDEAEEANRSKDFFLAFVSHELRSPLARQGVALGLARRRGNAEVMQSLDRIAREASRMNEMIGQLLDLTQVESGTEVITKAQIDLAALIERIAQDADYEARAIQRAVRVVQNQACETRGSIELLGSAIENVVRNAVRHTAPETEVEVSLTCESNNGSKAALVTVRDHGRGVPEKALNDIFRPFYRVEDARDRRSGGTGLGLAIATRAVGLHGGSINARNAIDGGLQVEIRIPQNGWTEK